MQKTLIELARSQFPSAREECAASGMVWERYLSELWQEIMGELWGAQWRRSLPVSPVSRARAAQADGRAGAPASEGLAALSSLRRLRPVAEAAGGAAPASETAADGAAEDGVNVVGSLGSPPGRVAGVEHFELATSRGSTGWEPQLGPAAMETMSEMGGV